MANKDITVWGIHAGKTGDAETLFLKKNFVALGWEKLGNPSTYKPNREFFKIKMAEAYPEMKLGALPVAAGQVFRFIHELKIGDVVVYPSKNDRQIHIGLVEGEYKYDPSLGEVIPICVKSNGPSQYHEPPSRKARCTKLAPQWHSFK